MSGEWKCPECGVWVAGWVPEHLCKRLETNTTVPTITPGVAPGSTTGPPPREYR